MGLFIIITIVVIVDGIQSSLQDKKEIAAHSIFSVDGVKGQEVQSSHIDGSFGLNQTLHLYLGLLELTLSLRTS